MPVYLPGNSTLYEFKANYVESASGDYVWMGELISRDSCNGEIVEDQCTAGYLRVLKEGERIFGEVQVDTAYYHIKYLGEGLWALVELDNDAFIPTSGSDCPMSGESPGARPAQSVEDRTDPCPVRVGILFTQAALDAHPDILDIIHLAVPSTNQILRNSDVDNSELSLILAGTQLLTTAQFSESGVLLNDVNSLVANTTVAAARTSMHADIIVVMTDAVYNNGDGAVAAFGDFATSGDSAFAIVEVASANHPNYTFAHEVAHLFGARHQNSSNCFTNHDDSGLAYAHGYAFTKGFTCCIVWDNKKYYHTVVSACYDNGQRQKIPHYSNPDVKYKGKKTGTVSTNDNASVLRGAACRVADYVGGETHWVSIAGFSRMCPGEINFLGAVIQGVPGPYVYEWYLSDDGFNWGDTVSTASGIEIVMPAQPGEVVFIKLIAGNANGPTQTAYKSVMSDTADLLCWRNMPVSHGESFASSLQIFPNPSASDVLTLRWQGDNGGQNAVLIFDSFGRQVGNFSRQMSKEENEMRINVGHLPNGVYSLKLQSRAFHHTLRFMLLR